ncbi:copper chaperone CopZ [Volucribacter psittacicida]|uniref:Copper chaperone CopZ n=1 Tax=Volucribacter psittacicida TaxID=203482 RepID=A0A4R1FTX1_9PAST|nr:heavy-metal-associated domain-containing protein [Volucribacter psittacicida]TCJ98746.1 copper chaperone CopZ [Volucribacter psittacicida]
MKKLVAVFLILYAQMVVASEKQVLLQIKEMTCQLCAYTVNKTLRDVQGVITTKANIQNQTVRVTAQQDLDNQRLIEAIESLNYSAVVQK